MPVSSQAEHELRVAQTEFDRQAEVTRLLLEGISSTHVSAGRLTQIELPQMISSIADNCRLVFSISRVIGSYVNWMQNTS